MLPLMFKTSSVEFYLSPLAIHFAPGTMSSLKSIKSHFKVEVLLSNLARGLPTSDFIKFFDRLRTSSFLALLIIGISPSDFRSFSATFKVLIVSF